MPNAFGHRGTNIHSPYPPSQVWPQFVEIYRAKVYFQPFPLFDHAGLTSQIPHWPPYLLQSFLAICLVFGDHPFYRPHKWSAHNYYVQSSRETTIPLAAEGVASLEVLQALCLLTLCDIAGQFSILCQPVDVSITFGAIS